MSLTALAPEPVLSRPPLLDEFTGDDIHVIRSDAEALEVVARLATELKKTAPDRDRDRRVPVDEVELITRSGLLGVLVPKEYGGAGVSIVTLAKILQTLSAADGSLGQIHQNHFNFTYVVAEHGREEQKQFFLSRILRGARLGNALAEPQDNYFLKGFATNLKRQTDGSYRLNGRKFYTTGAYLAHWLPVAVSEGEGKSALVYVPRHAPGVEVINDWSGMGQRNTLSGTATFDEVHITEDAIFRRPQNKYRPNNNSYPQIMHAAIDTGLAQGALEDIVWFVKNHARAWRESGQEEAGREPVLIKQFGELVVELRASEALLYHAARLLDASLPDLDNEEAALEAYMAIAAARAQADKASLRMGNELFEFGGSRSTVEKWRLDRHWRNARTHTMHDPARWKLHHLGNYHLHGVKPPVRP